jgi:hypothetical protein
MPTEKEIIEFIKKQEPAQLLQWCIINVWAMMHEMNADNIDASINLEKLWVKVTANIKLNNL